jgi:predicted aspartyl protease
MIRGTVHARFEAVIPLRVRGPGGAELSFDAVVDTGFTSSLTLPGIAVRARGLVRQSSSAATLGDGSVRSFDVYAVEVDWDGSWRPILVSAVGDEVLVGMRLLAGNELRVAVVPGGPVEISPRP